MSTMPTEYGAEVEWRGRRLYVVGRVPAGQPPIAVFEVSRAGEEVPAVALWLLRDYAQLLGARFLCPPMKPLAAECYVVSSGRLHPAGVAQEVARAFVGHRFEAVPVSEAILAEPPRLA